MNNSNGELPDGFRSITNQDPQNPGEKGVFIATRAQNELIKSLVREALQEVASRLKRHAPEPPPNESDPLAYWKSNRAIVPGRLEQFQTALEEYKTLKAILFDLEGWVSLDQLKKH